MKRLPTLVWRWTLTLAALVVAAAGSEDLVIRYRLAHNPASNVFEQVAIYEAGEVKGGKIEYYMDQPETQLCVHAIFPHFGSAPCWYVKRHTTKMISRGGTGFQPVLCPPWPATPPAWLRFCCSVPAPTVPRTGFRERAGRS